MHLPCSVLFGIQSVDVLSTCVDLFVESSLNDFIQQICRLHIQGFLYFVVSNCFSLEILAIFRSQLVSVVRNLFYIFIEMCRYFIFDIYVFLLAAQSKTLTLFSIFWFVFVISVDCKVVLCTLDCSGV